MMRARILPFLLLLGCTEQQLVAPEPVDQLDPGLDTLVLSPGESLAVVVIPRDEAGNQLYDRAITFSSTASAFAGIDSFGVVTAVAAGSGGIVFTSESAADTLPFRVVSSWVGGGLAAQNGPSCLLRPDRRAWCWGYAQSSAGVPTPRLSSVAFQLLDAGYYHTCGVAVDSTGWCWGYDHRGEILTDPRGFMDPAPEPVQQLPGTKFLSLSAGYEHTCGVTAAGVGLCWGRNSEGQLGDSAHDNSIIERTVQGGHLWRAIWAGDGGTCGLDADGAAWCWGWDWGFAGPPFVNYPTQVAGAPAFTSLTVGGGFACGLTGAGAAWCWGEDDEGQTGHGTAPSAAPVDTDVLFTFLAAGYNETCGLDAEGAAWCWGHGGHTGDGTWESHRVPAPVLGGHRFVTLVAGWSGFCGFTAGGAAWCWGAFDLWNDQALVPRRVWDP